MSAKPPAGAPVVAAPVVEVNAYLLFVRHQDGRVGVLTGASGADYSLRLMNVLCVAAAELELLLGTEVYEGSAASPAIAEVVKRALAARDACRAFDAVCAGLEEAAASRAVRS